MPAPTELQNSSWLLTFDLLSLTFEPLQPC